MPWGKYATLCSSLALGLAMNFGAGCKSQNTPAKDKASANKAAKSSPSAAKYPACEADKQHPEIPPGVDPNMLKASYWIEHLTPEKAEKVLLSPGQIATINDKTYTLEVGVRRLPEDLTPDAQEKQTSAFHQTQQDFVKERLADKRYVETVPGATQKADARIQKLTARDDYFALARPTKVRCWPIEGSILRKPGDLAFDRNNCSSLYPPSIVHRITSDQEGWHYVQGRYVEGWVHDPSWQPLSKKKVKSLLQGAKRWVTRDKVELAKGKDLQGRLGMVLPTDRRGKVSWPQSKGFRAIKLAKHEQIRKEPLPFRRDLLLQTVFSLLDRPYGWGGHNQERDCSRLLLDSFAAFGIELPRFSGHQAKVANSVDVSVLSTKDKRATIRRFAEKNVLLLFMPGHIMLYLGHEGSKDFAISAISEYVTPCQDKSGALAEQVHRLDRVTVTDLRLGLDSPRRSFLERITQVVRF